MSLNEKAYEGNIGLEEMMKFYEKANDFQIKKMDKAIKKEDWKLFKNLIFEVLGAKLL